ncbi:hypothetical protein [Mycolicibacterium phlei]|jgi:hypothetical protein
MKASFALLCGLVFGAFGLFALAWTVLFVLRGELLNAGVTVGISVFCLGFIAPFPRVVSGSVRPVTRCGWDEGTTFCPDRGVDIPLQLSLLGLVTAAAIYTIFAPIKQVSIPVPDSMRYALPLVCGLVVLLGIPMLLRTLSRGCSRYLRLSPDGIEIAEGWGAQVYDWKDVADITDEVPGRQSAVPGSVTFVLADSTTAAITARSITPDGSALRELSRFYWEHPEARVELTDGRAVERLDRMLADI